MAGTDRGDEVGILAQTFARMTDSLKSMAGVAGKIAAGDLRVNVRPQSEKDLLGSAFASMVENLQRLTTDLLEGVNVLGSAANEISASTTQLASSATESATAVSETTTTVEEVRQTSQMASQKAKAVSEIAQQTAQISQVGRKSAEEAIAGVGRIRQQMESIAGSMVRLSEQGQAIGQIIATVEDLAAQSNLLAVNAAIEAAKAGEHGKGFGVVAQEVKSLAEQSRAATNQVRTILGEIQKATAAAVMATEQGNKAVEAGRQTDRGRRRIDSSAGGKRQRGRTGRDANRGVEPAATRGDGPGGAGDGKHQAGEHAECRERQTARLRGAQLGRTGAAPQTNGRALQSLIDHARRRCLPAIVARDLQGRSR